MEDALQLLPHARPVFALKIEGVDVLIFLGRVFGVLDRAVRPLAEPVLVLAHVGMVGRGLEGDVQRDGEIELFGCCDKALEVLQSAQARQNGLVAAFLPRRWPRGCRDRPAALPGLLLRPLRKRAADGMNGRQVDDVEAHLGDIGQALFAIGKGAVLARLLPPWSGERIRTMR